MEGWFGRASVSLTVQATASPTRREPVAVEMSVCSGKRFRKSGDQAATSLNRCQACRSARWRSRRAGL